MYCVASQAGGVVCVLRRPAALERGWRWLEAWARRRRWDTASCGGSSCALGALRGEFGETPG
jgi:hypothetical protein